MPTQHASLVPAPAEHGEWDGDGYVDADLTRLDRPLKHPGRGTRVGKDRGTVAVQVSVDQLDSFFERLGVEDREDGSKDFGPVCARARRVRNGSAPTPLRLLTRDTSSPPWPRARSVRPSYPRGTRRPFVRVRRAGSFHLVLHTRRSILQSFPWRRAR